MTDTTILTPERDPMGAAILDYQTRGRASVLRVLSTMFDDDVIPVAHLFRTLDEMPPIEQAALAQARGKVLDVGAGAGCHALALQKKGVEVTAIDISPLSCEAMRLRGVTDVRCQNLFDPALEGPYDTILLLMNGTGIAGRLTGVKPLLERLYTLLAPGGQVLIDSSDLRYLYDDDDLPTDPYYGEVDYRMVYRSVRGERFDWLYLDYPRLSTFAAGVGLKAECIMEGEHYDYLARLTR